LVTAKNTQKSHTYTPWRKSMLYSITLLGSFRFHIMMTVTLSER